jgi:hypothetical protein
MLLRRTKFLRFAATTPNRVSFYTAQEVDSEIVPYSFDGYESLHSFLTSPNSFPPHSPLLQEEDTGDYSWLPEGQSEILKREAQMELAAQTIGKAFRFHRARISKCLPSESFNLTASLERS